MDDKRFFAARTELSDFVVWQAHEITKRTGKTYKAVADAPSTLAGLQAEWDKASPFPIWSGASGNTIYMLPWQNLSFRFWHDALHVQHKLDTTYREERLVADAHQEGAYFAGLGKDARKLLWADTAGQSLHCHKHGSFPINQLAFVKEFVSCAVSI